MQITENKDYAFKPAQITKVILCNTLSDSYAAC